jgi:hypothetical protein
MCDFNILILLNIMNHIIKMLLDLPILMQFLLLVNLIVFYQEITNHHLNHQWKVLMQIKEIADRIPTHTKNWIFIWI